MKYKWLFSFLGLFYICSSSLTGGGGVETGNGAVISFSDSSVKIKSYPGVSVGIYDSAYIPLYADGFSAQVVVGPDSEIVFSNLIHSSYNLAICDSIRQSGSFLKIRIDSIQLPDTSINFKSLLSVTGLISIKDMPLENRYVGIYMAGSPFGVCMKIGETFSFSNVPPAQYSLCVGKCNIPAECDSTKPCITLNSVLQISSRILEEIEVQTKEGNVVRLDTIVISY